MAEASFFPRAEPLSVADIAALARIDLPHGACGTATISGAAPLETAGPDDLVYMDNAKYAEVLGSTRAGACLVSKRFAGRVPAGTVALDVHCSGAQGTGYLDQFYFSQASNTGF